MKFRNCLIKMLKNEGGYVNNPADSGGETYKGISRKNFPEWIGWNVLDTYENKENVQNPLLDESVSEFYRENFWDKIKGDNIVNEVIAFEIFDTAVNMGVVTTSKLVQVTIGVSADGIIGVNTLSALNAINDELFIAKFKLAKVARYAYLVNKYPKNKVFLHGWINRTLGA